MVLTLDEWIAENFLGHGVAIRRKEDEPIPGEPFMSIEIAKELTREAVKHFATPRPIHSSSVSDPGDAGDIAAVAVAPAPSSTVEPSPGKGRGMFAARDFYAGEVIETTPVIPFRAGQPMPEELADLPLGWNGDEDCLAFGPLQFCNHCNDPNGALTHDLDDKTISIMARKHIKAGEEITFHYRVPLWFNPANPSPDTNFSKGKSEDAGLVERLLNFSTQDGACADLMDDAAAALEAKDAALVSTEELLERFAADFSEARSTIEAQAKEIADLKHDLFRYMDIANEHVNECERLREALEKIVGLTDPHTTLTGAHADTVFIIARAALKGGDGE
jgi:hypothetical protein